MMLRIAFLRGAQVWAFGAAASSRHRPPPSCLAAALSRFSSTSAAACDSEAQGPAAATGGAQPDPHAMTQTRGVVSPRETYERDVHSAWVWASNRFDVEMMADAVTGDVRDLPGREEDPAAVELARSAVAQHGAKTDAALEVVKLVKVRRQVEAGFTYYLTVEVREAGGVRNKLYEAKVLDKPWEKNYEQQLQAFEPVTDAA